MIARLVYAPIQAQSQFVRASDRLASWVFYRRKYKYKCTYFHVWHIINANFKTQPLSFFYLELRSVVNKIPIPFSNIFIISKLKFNHFHPEIVLFCFQAHIHTFKTKIQLLHGYFTKGNINTQIQTNFTTQIQPFINHTILSHNFYHFYIPIIFIISKLKFNHLSNSTIIW